MKPFYRGLRGTLWLTVLLVGACVGPPLLLTPAELPNAVEGTAYTQTLDADGNSSLRWSVTAGTLPPGITLGQQTGILSGTPATAGTYAFTIAVQRRGVPQRTGDADYTLTVIERLTLTADYDTARVGEAYDDGPTIAGGVPPYSVTIEGLPGGLDYERTTGRIFGTPLNAYDLLTLYVTIADSGTPQQTITRRPATFVIKPVGVSITTTEVDAGAVDAAYSFFLAATGGKQPYTWSVTEGVLPGSTSDPDHFQLDPDSGEIAGTARATMNTATFTVTVTDADTPASTASQEFKLVIPVVFVTTSLPDATRNQEYTQAVGAGAGLTPYTWSVVSGTLPAGLTLDEDSGVISGTVGGAATTQTFTIRVTDGDTPATTAEQAFTITVNP